MKNFLCIFLIILTLCPLAVSCKDKGKAQMLSFSQAQSIDEMKKLDGKQVSIIGYMSTLSPVSGKFMYLMNLPYQSCPFCIPNTTQLSNTIAVYAKDSKGFEFTDRAIIVTGTMEFGDYTDEFGYEYSYRIKDADYSILDTSNMSEELRLWQQIASTDVLTEVNNMFEYVNFLCFWGTYTAKFESGKDYLYPSNAVRFIENDGAQFNYGFKEGYFENIIKTVKEVDENAFKDLVSIVEKTEALADRAYKDIKDGKYSKVNEYSNAFKDGRKQYKMDNADAYETEFKKIYSDYSEWIASWEI